MWRRFWGWLSIKRIGTPLERSTHEELPDPVHIEVLLDGEVIGLMSDRVWVEMFWRSYRLAALDPRALDDDVWGQCRVTFRDWETGRVCTGAFVGGRPPFVQAGRILIRALYFERR